MVVSRISPKQKGRILKETEGGGCVKKKAGKREEMRPWYIWHSSRQIPIFQLNQTLPSPIFMFFGRMYISAFIYIYFQEVNQKNVIHRICHLGSSSIFLLEIKESSFMKAHDLVAASAHMKNMRKSNWIAFPEWPLCNAQNPYDIPLYWLINKDPYNGLL